MKKLSTSLILLTLICIMCGCEEGEPIIKLELFGKWQLRRGTSGWGESFEYPEGNGLIMEFTGKKYTVYDSGKLVRQGPYILVREKSPLSGEIENMIQFNTTVHKPKELKSIIEINPNELILSFNGYDGGYMVYRRLR